MRENLTLGRKCICMLPLPTKERHTNRLLASLAFPSLRLHLVPLPLHSSGSGNITKLTTQINITVFQRAPANTKEREINTSHFLVPTTSKLHLLHVITTQFLNPVCRSLNLCWSQHHTLSYLETISESFLNFCH